MGLKLIKSGNLLGEELKYSGHTRSGIEADYGSGYARTVSEGFNTYKNRPGNRAAEPQRAVVIAVLVVSSICCAIVGMILILGAESKPNNVSGTEPEKITSVTAQPESSIEILVPVRDIKKGEQLAASMFARVRRPQPTVSENAITNLEQVEGKFANTSIPAHFPIILDFVTSEAPSNLIMQRIPQGFRAVAINVNATSSVEGWTQAGAIVDVQWVGNIEGQLFARIIAENAKVISVERKIEAVEEKKIHQIPATVTLLASDNDAQKISLAASSGQLILHLRGRSDSGKVTNSRRALSLKDLWSASGSHTAHERIQGYVRADTESGERREWALIDGKLVEKFL